MTGITVATLLETIWTTIGITGLIISIRVLRHSRLNQQALKKMGLNGARSLIVSRDIVKSILYIIGNLGVIISGIIAAILFPQAPNTLFIQILRLLFPLLLIVVGVMLCLLPINDDIAQRKFIALIDSTKEEPHA